MEITLGMTGPRRRTHDRARWPLRRRRTHIRESDVMSVDDLLQYRLLERLAADRKLSNLRLWQWAGGAPGRGLPAPLRAPTPDYVMLELESEARAAETTAARDAAGSDAAELVLAAMLLGCLALFLLTRLVRCCCKRRTKDEPNEEQIVPSSSEQTISDPPPPYTELPAEDKAGEEPPPPYSASYVAFADPKDGSTTPSIHFHNERENHGELAVNMQPEDHRTSEDAIEASSFRLSSVELSRRCEGLQVVT